MGLEKEGGLNFVFRLSDSVTVKVFHNISKSYPPTTTTRRPKHRSLWNRDRSWSSAHGRLSRQREPYCADLPLHPHRRSELKITAWDRVPEFVNFKLGAYFLLTNPVNHNYAPKQTKKILRHNGDHKTEKRNDTAQMHYTKGRHNGRVRRRTSVRGGIYSGFIKLRWMMSICCMVSILLFVVYHLAIDFVCFPTLYAMRSHLSVTLSPIA